MKSRAHCRRNGLAALTIASRFNCIFFQLIEKNTDPDWVDDVDEDETTKREEEEEAEQLCIDLECLQMVSHDDEQELKMPGVNGAVGKYVSLWNHAYFSRCRQQQPALNIDTSE
jgi:hypothetical protein